MPSYFLPSEGDEEPRCFEIETVSDGCYKVITPEGDELLIDAYEPEPGRLNMLIDNKSYDVDVRETDREFTVQLRGEKHHVTALNERQRRMKIAGVGARGGGGPNLESPMAGKVVAVHVAAGDDVETGQKVVIVEAMKMENDLKAHKGGSIAEICVAPGDAVEIGDVLLKIAE